MTLHRESPLLNLLFKTSEAHMTTSVWMKIFGGIAIVGGAVGAALTAGTVPAIVAGVAALGSYIAGLNHPTPAATKAFGTEAK